MKVWTVRTCYDYEGSALEGIFSTLELAEAYAAKCRLQGAIRGEIEVEEVDVDHLVAKAPGLTSPIDERDARWIRMLRVEMGCTWERLGQLYEQMSGSVYNDGYVQSGAFLCLCAASLLGEDCGAPPWL